MTKLVHTVRRWSTEDVPAEVRLEYWTMALSTALIPMSVESPSAADFHADQEAISLGSIAVVRSRGGAHCSRRDQRHLGRSEAESYHLMVALSGAWSLRHRGDRTLVPGDVILTDSRYEHELRVRQDYDIINLKLSMDWLRTWIPDPQVLVGARIPRDTDSGRSLSLFVSQLSPGALVHASMAHSVLADQVGALLAIAADRSCPVSQSERTLRVRIEASIRERYSEADLEASAVAVDLDVEARIVHGVLASGGTTFAALLLDVRADYATEMLTSRHFGLLSTREIALRCGFRDTRHFERVIRARTGISPEQLRMTCGMGRGPQG